MAFDSQLAFDNSNTVTITLASLADGSIATSDAIDNSTDKFIYADIQVKVRTDTGTDDDGIIKVKIIRSADGGTTYDDSSTNSEIIYAFLANADSTDFIATTDTGRIGLLPSHWKIAILNDSGAALDSTASSHSVVFSGKHFEIEA